MHLVNAVPYKQMMQAIKHVYVCANIIYKPTCAVHTQYFISCSDNDAMITHYARSTPDCSLASQTLGREGESPAFETPRLFT